MMTLTDWHSSKTHIFANHKYLPSFTEQISTYIKKINLTKHIILSTSGSTNVKQNEVKWVALSKEAFLNSAEAVNKHLNCSSSDIILNTLPLFHVGGLSQFARAYTSKAKIINLYHKEYKWDVNHFVGILAQEKITLTSLVPTQAFDIVKNNLQAPKYLKNIVIGGGFLSEILYKKLKHLGWNILPSYGMTECCSQIATAQNELQWENGIPGLKILEHNKIKINNELISITSSSLLTSYIFQENNNFTIVDPKKNDDFYTTDRGYIKDNFIYILGRNDDIIKIKGELVNLSKLQTYIEELCQECVILGQPHERNEHSLQAVFSKKIEANVANEIVELFNKNVLPFEKISSLFFVDHIPRTELGKIKKKEIQQDIQNKISTPS